MKKKIVLPSGELLRGPQSADELNLLNYIPLAVKFAGKYQHNFDDFDDAFQIAFLGLIKARDKWDPERGPFGTIVTLYVRGALKDEIYARQRAAGRSVAETTNGRYLASRGRKFDPLLPNYVTVSANQIGPAGQALDLLEHIPDDAPNAEDMLGERQEIEALKQRIAEAMTVLNERERRVITARITADKDDASPTRSTPKAASLEMLALELGVSRERVRQIEVNALAKLRAFLQHGPSPPKELKPPRTTAPRVSVSSRARAWLLAQPPEAVAAAMAGLTERHRRVIALRTMADVPAATRDLAASFGVHSEVIRIQEIRAIDNLRRALGAPPLGKPHPRRKAPRQAAMTPPKRKPARTVIAASSGGRQRRPNKPRPVAWEKDAAGRWQAVAWAS